MPGGLTSTGSVVVLKGESLSVMIPCHLDKAAAKASVWSTFVNCRLTSILYAVELIVSKPSFCRQTVSGMQVGAVTKVTSAGVGNLG